MLKTAPMAIQDNMDIVAPEAEPVDGRSSSEDFFSAEAEGTSSEESATGIVPLRPGRVAELNLERAAGVATFASRGRAAPSGRAAPNGHLADRRRASDGGGVADPAERRRAGTHSGRACPPRRCACQVQRLGGFGPGRILPNGQGPMPLPQAVRQEV